MGWTGQTGFSLREGELTPIGLRLHNKIHRRKLWGITPAGKTQYEPTQL